MGESWASRSRHFWSAEKKMVDFQWCFVMFLMMFDDFQWGFSMTSIVSAALRMVFFMPCSHLPRRSQQGDSFVPSRPRFGHEFWVTQQAEHGDMPGLWQNMMPWKLYEDPQCWPQLLMWYMGLRPWYGYKSWTDVVELSRKIQKKNL